MSVKGCVVYLYYIPRILKSMLLQSSFSWVGHIGRAFEIGRPLGPRFSFWFISSYLEYSTSLGNLLGLLTFSQLLYNFWSLQVPP